MYVGASFVLIIAGAILAWAVDVNWESFNINMAGYIIFGVGILALFISFYTMWSKKKRADQAARSMNGPPPGGPGAPTGPGAPGGPRMV